MAASDVLGTGWFGAVAADVKPGKTVAVVGDGAVGLLAVLAARWLGAERIIATSRHESRQKLALESGATDIVAERGDEGVALVKESVGLDVRGDLRASSWNWPCWAPVSPATVRRSSPAQASYGTHPPRDRGNAQPGGHAQRQLHPHPSTQLRRVTNMTTPTDIDRSAPVIAHHEIDINARLDNIWRLQTDVNNWPAWQTSITAARLDGTFEPGNSFTWTSYGFTVTSTIYAVAERARTLWGGAARGITGTHEWVYSQTATGVHVTTHESFSGESVQADIPGMQSALDKSLIDWLGQLKAAAESTD